MLNVNKGNYLRLNRIDVDSIYDFVTFSPDRSKYIILDTMKNGFILGVVDGKWGVKEMNVLKTKNLSDNLLGNWNFTDTIELNSLDEIVEYHLTFKKENEVHLSINSKMHKRIEATGYVEIFPNLDALRIELKNRPVLYFKFDRTDGNLMLHELSEVRSFHHIHEGVLKFKKDRG